MAADILTKHVISGDTGLQVSQLAGVVSKSVVRELRPAAAPALSPCAAAVVVHHRRAPALAAVVVVSLPSSVSVFTEGKEIGESSCLGSQDDVNVVVCSEVCGPSNPQAHRACAAESAAEMTSWA